MLGAPRSVPGDDRTLLQVLAVQKTDLPSTTAAPATPPAGHGCPAEITMVGGA
jgi:hypothetical protein